MRSMSRRSVSVLISISNDGFICPFLFNRHQRMQSRLQLRDRGRRADTDTDRARDLAAGREGGSRGNADVAPAGFLGERVGAPVAGQLDPEMLRARVGLLGHL